MLRDLTQKRKKIAPWWAIGAVGIIGALIVITQIPAIECSFFKTCSPVGMISLEFNKRFSFGNEPETLIALNNARLRAENRKTYKIAVSVPIGKVLPIAEEILRGAAHAQNEINRNGGINGVGLEIEIINDDNDQNITRKIAEVLVKDTNILAVIGHNTGDASLGAAPISQNINLLCF